MTATLARDWPEYLMEAAGLGSFVLSAGGFAILLFHPASPVAPAIADPVLQARADGLSNGAHRGRSGMSMNPTRRYAR